MTPDAAPATPPAHDGRVGLDGSAGDFTVHERIGEGSAAVVHRAVHRSMGIEVALKVWRRDLAAAQRGHFLQECRLQWQLSDHPRIVRLYWAGAPDDGPPWLAMELFPQSLANRLTRGEPLSEVEAAQIADDLVSGLAALHEGGVLHRDVKPANVMLRDGRAALGDFGIATPVGVATMDTAAGTELFVAPELFADEPPSTRSDVYSAAVTVGRLFADPPPRLDAVLTRASSYHAADRPADASALLGLLRAALNPPARQADTATTQVAGPAAGPRRARRAHAAPTGRRRIVRRTGLAVIAVVVLAAGTWRWLDPGATAGITGTTAKTLSAPTAPGSGLPPGVPAAAPSGVVVDPGDGAADVTWAAPDVGGDAEAVVAAVAADGSASPGCVAPTGATTCRITGLTNGVTYAVTVSLRTEAGTGPQAPPQSTVPYPESLMSGPDLALWLDGSDPTTLLASSGCTGPPADAAVGCWVDKSDRTNNAAQDALAYRPKIASSSGRRQLSFPPGSSLAIARPADLPVGTTPSTVFVTARVGRPVVGPPRVALSWGSDTDPGAARTFAKVERTRGASVGGGIEGGAKPGRWDDEVPTVVVGQHTATQVSARLNGSAATTVDIAVDTGVNSAYVGRGPGPDGLFWQGSVAEIIVFDRILDAAELTAVDNYLFRKWGVGIP